MKSYHATSVSRSGIAFVSVSLLLFFISVSTVGAHEQRRVTTDTTPSKPRTAVAENIEANAALLNWKKPSSGTIGKYVVQVRKNNVSNKDRWTTYSKVQKTQKKVEELDADTTYEFRVRACKQGDCSKFTSWMKFETLEAVEDDAEEPDADEDTGADDSDDANDVVAQTVEVDVQNFNFDPSEVTIAVGDTVRWINSGVHTVTLLDGSINSGTLTTGEQFEYTFTEVGTYEFYCDIHGSSMTHGLIIVQ